LGIWADGKERERGTRTNLDGAVEDADDANVILEDVVDLEDATEADAVLEDAVDLEDVTEPDAVDLLLLHDPVGVHLEQHVGDAWRGAPRHAENLMSKMDANPWRCVGLACQHNLMRLVRYLGV
jgi:hypothetical protein